MTAKKNPGRCWNSAGMRNPTLSEEKKTMTTVSPMTPTQVDFVSQFADYDIIVRVTDEEFPIEDGGDGTAWVSFGRLSIMPWLKRITVRVGKGTEALRVYQMEALAHQFRDGINWPACLAFDLHAAEQGDWYRSNLIGKTIDPAWRPSGLRVVRCHDGACRSSYHDYNSTTVLGTPEILHFGESIAHPQGHYTVAMTRETGKAWGLDIETGDVMNVFVARALTNDISWLSAECDKLNAVETGDRS